MSLTESIQSLTRDLKGIHELEQYGSGDYDSLDEIEEEMHEEWETYKQENNLDELGELNGTFKVERKGGFLRPESLSVRSADYIVRFEQYETEGEESSDRMFEADYLTYDNGVNESEDVPAFFRGFLADNFELD